MSLLVEDSTHKETETLLLLDYKTLQHLKPTNSELKLLALEAKSQTGEVEILTKSEPLLIPQTMHMDQKQSLSDKVSTHKETEINL